MTPSGGRVAPTSCVALVMVVALMLTGCSSGADSGSSVESSTTTTTPDTPGVPLAGRVFALAGERSVAADLYELQFAPLRLTRLTDVGRVSALGGCETMLVVAAAQIEVGLTDTIQAVQNGRFAPIDGLGTPKGFAPALNRGDCRLSFTDVDRSTPDLTNRLYVWDPKSQTKTMLEEAPYLAGRDWGPGGRLAVVLNRGGSPGVPIVSTDMIIFGPNDSKKTMPAPAPDLGALHWGSSPSMAFVRVDAKATLFFNPDTGARSELAGWWPLGWSPDGQQLLLTDANHQRELGVVAASDFATVRRVGTAPVGVYGSVWLPSGAEPETGSNS